MRAINLTRATLPFERRLASARPAAVRKNHRIYSHIGREWMEQNERIEEVGRADEWA